MPLGFSYFIHCQISHWSPRKAVTPFVYSAMIALCRVLCVILKSNLMWFMSQMGPDCYWWAARSFKVFICSAKFDNLAKSFVPCWEVCLQIASYTDNAAGLEPSVSLQWLLVQFLNLQMWVFSWDDCHWIIHFHWQTLNCCCIGELNK